MYVANYPTETPAFGFIDYPFILDLGLDHVYTTWYFLFLLGALGSSLAACTLTRQLPVWRVSAEWKFLDRPAALMRMEEAETLPRAKLSDLAENLSRRGYQVFVKGKKLYAFKGLIGRLAPIGVHAALLLTLGGSAFSGLGGLGGSVMVPEGASFQIAQGLTRGAMFAPTPKAARDAVVVNDFTIEYLPNGQVSQFFSDLSVVDGKSGAEKQRKVISVNVPLARAARCTRRTGRRRCASASRMKRTPPARRRRGPRARGRGRRLARLLRLRGGETRPVTDGEFGGER